MHEFAGDCRSWEPQVRHFSRRYRCITYCARGYLPSEAPDGIDRYSQERWRDDLRSVLDALDLPAAHIVGCRWVRSRACISGCATAARAPRRARCR